MVHRMFSSLFGKKKEKPQPQAISNSVIVDTTLMLIQKEEDLEKRNKMLETKSRIVAQEAIEANKAGKKQAALVCLNKRKLYEKEIENNNALILKLVMQRTTVETSNTNTETFNVMKIANEVVKQQQRDWTPEKVADLTDDMHELMGNQTEISDLIATPLGSDLLGMADLEAELAALEEPVPVPVPTEPLKFPEVPTTAPVIRSIDDELRALEAAM